MAALDPEDDMRLSGRGWRRFRRAFDRLRMAWSPPRSMPGAPLICHGDEIGIGKDLSRKGCDAPSRGRP
ncbi:hypothetical protein [Paracoccus fontiphilus]|uniref:hypothetical protein n=1 Tax=Paracoccus fontiphilus TaxID=1815556 RepID=UPI003670B270